MTAHISRELTHVFLSGAMGLVIFGALALAVIGVYVLFYFKICDTTPVTLNGICSHCGGMEDVINGECKHCYKANRTTCWPGDVVQ